MNKAIERMIEKDRNSAVKWAASFFLNIETLAERKSDGLNFHEIGVVALRKALESAYNRGLEDATKHAAEAKKYEPPKVGDAATLSYGSDCEPATVIAVSKSGHEITIQLDDWKITSGGEHDGSAQYEYSRNPNGGKVKARRRKNGRYGTKNSSRPNVHIGSRRRYYDPHF